MNLQNLVTSLELSKRLFEEGITKDGGSRFAWILVGPECWEVAPSEIRLDFDVFYPALTLEELMRVLPESFKIVDLYLGTGSSPDHYYLNINKAEFGDYAASLVNRHRHSLTKVFFKKSPLEALSSLTTWLLDEGYLKANS